MEQAISFEPEIDPPERRVLSSCRSRAISSPFAAGKAIWVHFTLDGRAPTKLSPLYQKPILLGPAKDKDKAGIVLRAAAFWAADNHD